MSKKLKAAGKKGSKSGGKKSVAKVKKKSAPARKASPKKSAKKKPVTKSAKKVAAKAVKAIKTVSKSIKKPASASAKKGIVKKVTGTVKKAIKTVGKPAAGNKKIIKSASKSEKKVTKQALPVSGVKTGKITPKPSRSMTAAVAASSKSAHSGNGSAKKAPEKEKTTNDNRKLNDLFNKKPAERKTNEVLAITNTIPVKTKNELSPSKIASISNSITNPVRKTDSYSVKAEKEPPGKFEMEFVVHASAEMLYEFLSTASGLSEWFCDDLNIRNGIYTFIWDDQLQQARLLKTVDQQLVRFQWVEKTDGSYFEFKIQRDDLTNDISLIITDFADTASERESSKLLWNSQVEKLMHVIGSIF